MKHEKEFNQFFEVCIWILQFHLQDFDMGCASPGALVDTMDS
jgi:hypothetical protein